MVTTPEPSAPADPNALTTGDRELLAWYLGSRLESRELRRPDIDPALVEAWAKSPKIARQIDAFIYLHDLSTSFIRRANDYDAHKAVGDELRSARTSTERLRAVNAFIRLSNSRSAPGRRSTQDHSPDPRPGANSPTSDRRADKWSLSLPPLPPLEPAARSTPTPSPAHSQTPNPNIAAPQSTGPSQNPGPATDPRSGVPLNTGARADTGADSQTAAHPGARATALHASSSGCSTPSCSTPSQVPEPRNGAPLDTRSSQRLPAHDPAPPDRTNPELSRSLPPVRPSPVADLLARAGTATEKPGAANGAWP